MIGIQICGSGRGNTGTHLCGAGASAGLQHLVGGVGRLPAGAGGSSPVGRAQLRQHRCVGRI